jgi:S1-C subfamily serine protease
MTTIPSDRRRLRAAALLVALLALLAPAPAVALDGPLPIPATIGAIGSPSPIALNASSGGVVNVVSRLDKQGQMAAGTGIVLGTSGQVLTNNHVIHGAQQIRVSVPGGQPQRAVVVGTDPTHDVALLAVRGQWNAPPATLGDSSKVAVGDPVEAIGNVGGLGVPTVATGVVTGLDRSVTAYNDNGADPEHLQGMIETNANIQPGDSGGPLVNASGQVIGMNTAASTGNGSPVSAPDGFAIPINTAMGIVQHLQSGTAVTASANRRHRSAHHRRARHHR